MKSKNGVLRVGFIKEGYHFKAGASVPITKDLIEKGYFVKGTELKKTKKKRID
jgi:hypothetical protein